MVRIDTDLGDHQVVKSSRNLNKKYLQYLGLAYPILIGLDIRYRLYKSGEKKT